MLRTAIQHQRLSRRRIIPSRLLADGTAVLRISLPKSERAPSQLDLNTRHSVAPPENPPAQRQACSPAAHAAVGSFTAQPASFPQAPTPPKDHDVGDDDEIGWETDDRDNHDGDDSDLSCQDNVAGMEPDLPNFEPFDTGVPAHNTLPTILRDLGTLPPAAVFRQLFISELITTSTENTNAYAAIKKAGAGGMGGEPRRKRSLSTEGEDSETRSPVTEREMQQWLGIEVYMGMHPVAVAPDYWANDGRHPSHPAAKFMSCARFEQIRRYLHISAVDLPERMPRGPGGDVGRRLTLRCHSVLLDQLRHSSILIRTPFNNVAIGETMLPCKERNVDTYPMSKGPMAHVH